MKNSSVTKILAVLVVLFVQACAVETDTGEDTGEDSFSSDSETVPTCAELGCPNAPSGSSIIWEPCAADQEICYCGAPAERCER